ncbi:metallopeptidase family protein [Sinirhodobacter sp. WL0062]|uniref:Metallopeptidase family protein n=1 Tax=Rhodobacter flavimaris TaxID=2907145 RepID=A0ABS8Z0J1_9RHOB|nr:metallopeptidase family protein [Sinirhodobacter sp. WL0062]MCE5974417.1 metallopeptidase family protein [Sinirhodobacter sp. WL0062]
MDGWNGRLAPTLAEFEALAEAARATLPEAFRAPAAAVVLRVEDFAPEDLLDEMEIEDAFELTGLYEGIPMTEKSVMDPGGPDVIWLFRRPILDEWAARGDVPLDELIAHVFIHELAHHFGWSDGDIATIDRWWE